LKKIYPEYEIEEIKYDTSALDDDDLFWAQSKKQQKIKVQSLFGGDIKWNLFLKLFMM
jgi:hypothetical protein